MPTTYKTPGVYTEEITRFPPSIAAVETAIPAFIGYTEKAMEDVAGDLTLKPKRITSLVDYEVYFGTAQPEENIKVTVAEEQDAEKNTISLKVNAKIDRAARSKHIMYYALQMFFANGGGPCYVVSVGDYLTLGDPPVAGLLDQGLKALEKEDEPTLIVFPEAQNLPIGGYASLHDAALKQCADLKDRFVIMDLHGGDQEMDNREAGLLAAAANFRKDGIGINNLKYGAVYAPNLETTVDFVYDETKTDVTHTLTGAPTPATPATPGTPAIPATPATSVTSVTKLSALADDNNRRYELAKAAIRDCSCMMPPSSTMAGIYASVDEERGVWKAPANVSVANVIKPAITCSHALQGDLNIDPNAGKSINAIRTFVGKGTLVWGARTLAGNDNEWRYINVRRFFNMVEESTKKATEAFVFEPNDANTWVRVQAMIENFLTTMWRQGALQGVKPEHAFYVAVGLGKTMTALDILEGRMIVEIGMAVVRPAEFIILRFSHKMAES